MDLLNLCLTSMNFQYAANETRLTCLTTFLVTTTTTGTLLDRTLSSTHTNVSSGPVTNIRGTSETIPCNTYYNLAIYVLRTNLDNHFSTTTYQCQGQRQTREDWDREQYTRSWILRLPGYLYWFSFYIYAWPTMLCLYFIYAHKIYLRFHVKITR